MLARHHIYSLVDSHQDAFNESVGASWNGFPDWATYTDGFPLKPDPGFPAVYFTSPAQNQTWTNLWRDHAAADGVGLQEHYAAMWERVAKHFGHQPYVLGYDLINEPWPSWEYPTCLPSGCPRFETGALTSFQAKAMTAIRLADQDHMVFFEPPMLNDFGIPNWMPNPASWIFWSEPESQTPKHPQAPPTGPNLMNPTILRPYPQAIAGTPQQWNYDTTTGTFTLQYSTRPIDSGRPFAPGTRTEVFLPQSAYPNGYQVQSQGAAVVSSPNAPVLDLVADAGQDSVRVTVTRQ